MNKIGVCLGGMCPSIDNIKIARQIGFDYVELHLAEIMKYSPEERKCLKCELEKNNLNAEVLYAFFPYQLKIVGKKADKNIIKGYIQKAVETANFFDSKLLVVGSGGSRSYEKSCDDCENAENQFAEVIKLIRDEVPMGMDVVCEPISIIESNLINTLEQCDMFIRKFSLNQIGTMIDSYHVLIENESIINLEKNISKVRHIHLSNKERRYPQSDEDISELLQMLVRNDYQGRISIEAITENFISDARQAFKIVNGLIEKI